MSDSQIAANSAAIQKPARLPWMSLKLWNSRKTTCSAMPDQHRPHQPLHSMQRARRGPPPHAKDGGYGDRNGTPLFDEP